MFYCREEELQAMNRRYEKGRFECIVIYGRRRVGKTALINEFCKGKPTVYFSALSASSLENLEALSKAIYTCKNPEGAAAPTYRSYNKHHILKISSVFAFGGLHRTDMFDI